MIVPRPGMINDRRFLLVFSLALIVGHPVAGAGEPARKCPVLVTFDVEIEADIAALNALNPPGSCTIFVTGEFAQAHPDHVKQWAQRHEIACHTMTHPHMLALDAAKQFAEIRDSAEAVRRATGIFPLGFRAPIWNRTTRLAKPWSSLAFAISRPRGKATMATTAMRRCSNSRSPMACSRGASPSPAITTCSTAIT